MCAGLPLLMSSTGLLLAGTLSAAASSDEEDCRCFLRSFFFFSFLSALAIDFASFLACMRHGRDQTHCNTDDH